MAEITIKLDGADAVRERLREISSRMSNLSPILKAIGDRVAEQTKRRVESQGPAPDGTPWAPLKPATLARKKHAKILTESGHLRDSIRYQLAGSNTVTVGTNLVYAAIHQLGGRTPARTILPVRKKALYWPGAAHPVKSVSHPGSLIPARPFLGLSDRDSREIIDMINDYITRR